MEGSLMVVMQSGDWRRRYARLRDGTLSLSKRSTSASPLVEYKLSFHAAVRALCVDDERKLCFTIESEEFSVVAEAPTQYEQTVWLSALADICGGGCAARGGAIQVSPAVRRAAEASARCRLTTSTERGGGGAAEKVVDHERQMLRQSGVVGRRLDAHRRAEARSPLAAASSSPRHATAPDVVPAETTWTLIEKDGGAASFYYAATPRFPGWCRLRQLAPSNAKPYWHNEARGITQWHAPTISAVKTKENSEEEEEEEASIALSLSFASQSQSPSQSPSRWRAAAAAAAAEPSKSASPVLLWREATDAVSGRTYYYNTVTSESCWVLDANDKVNQAASAAAIAATKSAGFCLAEEQLQEPAPAKLTELELLRRRVRALEAANDALKADAARRAMDAEAAVQRHAASAREAAAEIAALRSAAAVASSAAASDALPPTAAAMRCLQRKLRNEKTKCTRLEVELEEVHFEIITLKMSQRRNPHAPSTDGSGSEEEEEDSLRTSGSGSEDEDSASSWHQLDELPPTPSVSTPRHAFAG